MENYEYSRSFTSVKIDETEFDPVETEKIKNLLHSHEQDLRDNPRFIIPFAPEVFEKTVTACEQIAKEFSGKIKAKIDYSFFTATIELWCCYVEFQRGEFMGILHQISLDAISIRFTPLISGELHIEILMPYFTTAREIRAD